MSGAILQPPTRPDADYGVLFIEVSGCLPMCGHGTIGVATVLVETGMVEVDRAGDHDPAGHPGRPGRRRGRGRRTGTPTSVTIRNVPSFSRRARRAWSTCPGSARSRYDLAFGGNFYAIVDLDRARPAVRPGGEGPAAATPGWPSWTPSTTQDAPVHPVDPDDPRLPPRRTARARLRRPALAARHGDPPRLVRPLAVRHRHQRPDGPAARPRASWRWTPTSSTSRSSAPGSSAGWSRTTDGRPACPRSCRPSPAGPGSPAPPSTCSTPTDPFPAGFLL